MGLIFKEPTLLQARYRIVTPMFIGDAQQKATGISPTSIKGALRFWWRALNWGRIRTHNASDKAALQDLHAQESELFGSSAEQGQAASFTLQSNTLSRKAQLPASPHPGLQYLLGQGLFFHNQYQREALAADQELEIKLTLTPDKAHYAQQLQDALIALGCLGGLGSRARKGFGSLAIQSLTVKGKEIAIPQDIQTLKQQLLQYKSTAELPPFTAFSKQTRIDISLTHTNALAALQQAGSEQQLYRSWGQNGKVAGKDAEKNFPQDHDLVAELIPPPQTVDKIPQRSVFGLPHNYFFSSRKKGVDFSPAGKERSRRASPLLIHVHQFPDEKTALIHTLLPATFLPEKEPLEFKIGSKKRRVLFDEAQMIDWQILHTYLDRFTNRETVL